jgi:hypothetical protein
MSERKEKFTRGPLCWVRCENPPDGGPSGGITIWADFKCECGMVEDFCECDYPPTLIEDGDASELSDADAALFAAAPEMYAALDAFLSTYERCKDTHGQINYEIAEIGNMSVVEKARAALAKARGEA